MAVTVNEGFSGPRVEVAQLSDIPVVPPAAAVPYLRSLNNGFTEAALNTGGLTAPALVTVATLTGITGIAGGGYLVSASGLYTPGAADTYRCQITLETDEQPEGQIWDTNLHSNVDETSSPRTFTWSFQSNFMAAPGTFTNGIMRLKFANNAGVGAAIAGQFGCIVFPG